MALKKAISNALAGLKKVQVTFWLGEEVLERKTLRINEMDDDAMSPQLEQVLGLAGALHVIVATGEPRTERSSRGVKYIIPVLCDGQATTLRIETVKL